MTIFMDHAAAGGFRENMKALLGLVDKVAENDVSAVIAQAGRTGRCREWHWLDEAIG